MSWPEGLSAGIAGAVILPICVGLLMASREDGPIPPPVVGLIAEDQVIPCDERARFLRARRFDDPRRELTSELDAGI